MSGFSGAASAAVVGKNYLLNPSGEVAQAPVGSQSDVTYDFDQWLTLTQSNPITASSVADAENSTPYMMRSLQANASAQRFGRIQWLTKGQCRDLRGQSVALSARVRMSASTTLRYAVVEWTGTADTITKDIVNDWTSATFTTGNFFTSTSTTVVATGSIALIATTLTDITALIGTVSSSMNNLAVFFWTDSMQAQNVTLDIGKVKLEKGSAATAFVPRTFQQELADCLNFYRQSYDYGVTPGTASLLSGLICVQIGTNTINNFTSYGAIQYGTPMFKNPTITIYGYGGTSGVVSNSTPADLTAGSGASSSGSSAKQIVPYNNSGGTVTTTGNAVFFHYVATARL